jgi:hypothetical protein
MIIKPRSGVTRRSAMAAVAASLGGALIGRRPAAREFLRSDITKEKPSTPHVLRAAWANWGPSDSYWWGLNNTYDADDVGLVNGVDYTQSVTVYPGSIPVRTLIQWNFGSHVSPINAWGLPEIIYGKQAGGRWPNPNGLNPTPIQIGALNHFTMSWNINLTGDLNYYDVLAEHHLSATLTGKDLEFGVFLWMPPSGTTYWDTHSPIWPINVGGFSGEVCHEWAANSFAMAPNSVKNGTPWLSGTIDFLPIIQWGISESLLPATYYLQGFELGIEVQQGSGSMTVNSLSYSWG